MIEEAEQTDPYATCADQVLPLCFEQFVFNMAANYDPAAQHGSRLLTSYVHQVRNCYLQTACCCECDDLLISGFSIRCTDKGKVSNSHSWRQGLRTWHPSARPEAPVHVAPVQARLPASPDVICGARAFLFSMLLSMLCSRTFALYPCSKETLPLYLRSLNIAEARIWWAGRNFQSAYRVLG